MNFPLCIRCHKRPATIFIQQAGTTPQQGYCLKCAHDLNIGPVNQIMERMGISEEDLEEVTEQMDDIMSTMGDSFEAGGAPAMPFNVNMLSPDGNDPQKKNGEKHKNGKDKNAKEEKKLKFISTYCTDLTAKAKKGELDAIIGRDDVIYRVTQILCRRTKNNPCLIGDPGVGKTAVAEGLAIQIASGDVPARLFDKRLCLLDLTALVAGTQFRGQFESRIKGLVDEVKREGNIILFIDEIHNLVGAGDASDGAMNAANILKPALSRGEIQVVGATTFNEYRKHIEKDAALERRFQPVKVEEPSISEAAEILRGIKGYYEAYHRVEISDALVYRAVVLSERYINDRFLPDKAIDLLDEACTCANLRNKAIAENEINEKLIADLEKEENEIMTSQDEIDYQHLQEVRSRIISCKAKGEELREKAKDNKVTEDDLARVVSLWTGIPVRKIMDSDVGRLVDLEKHLKARIIGQDQAVEKVCAAVRRSRVRLGVVKRPASFIFVGPTGVGKTELVKQLANELFDTPETLIRLDMSEFMEKFSVSRLIGSPPGYVGYDEAGQLTEKVRRKPYSVILFDEIEKAHPDVLNILLQILDEGKTSDAQGRVVSFENTVIIMTSNAGSSIKSNLMGFGQTEESAAEAKAMKALEEFLRPEFIGRVDEVVYFRPLGKDDYVRIAELLVKELEPALNERGISFHVEPGVYADIAEKSAGGVRGARDIRNEIRRSIEDKMVDLIIGSHGTELTDIYVRLENGSIVVSSIE